MGVRGLQSFLKKNAHLLATSEELSDINLVIDANSILCLLYTRSCLDREGKQFRDDVYGGDLVAYSDTVKRFFKNLEECKIKPVLVIDGSVVGKAALNNVVSKERDTYERALEKFERLINATESIADGGINMPQTLSIVFRNVVNDLGIRKIQAPYEADSHIARMANELNCPVLTNDSDFIIYDLKEGFLMFDFFEYNQPIPCSGRVAAFCMRGKIFRQSKLVQTLPGIQKNMMPILSVLLGNDYIDRRTSSEIIRTIRPNNNNTSPLLADTFRHKQIANILEWMRQRPLSNSIRLILAQVQNSVETARVFRWCINIYEVEPVDNFDRELEEVYPSSKANVKSIESGRTPVLFLRNALENGDTTAMMLDIIFQNTIYSNPILDDFWLPCSGLIKSRPDSLALVLLRSRSMAQVSTKERASVIEQSRLTTYHRVEQAYRRRYVRQIEELEGFGSVNHLDCYSMINLKPDVKKKLLMASFRFTADEMKSMTASVSRVLSGSFVTEAALCFILVKYAFIEANLPSDQNFVSALMVTIFYYAALSGNTNTDKEANDGKDLVVILSPLAMTNIGDRSSASTDHSTYRRIMHFINMLQSAYQSYCLINTLLETVFHSPRIGMFFNSTLIFRVTRSFKAQDSTAQGLRSKFPALIDTCESIQAQTVSLA